MKNAVTLEQFTQIVAPVTAHAHVSGAKGVDGEGVAFSEGDVDMGPVMRRLNNRNIGVSLEIWYGHKDGYRKFLEGWKAVDAMLGATA